MRFAGLKFILKSIFNFNLKLVDVASSWRWSTKLKFKMEKNIFSDRKMDLRKDIMKYGYLVVFIRHGSAGIWGFQYGVTLGLGTLEIMAWTGFFGLVICALNCATKRFPSKPSMILTYRRDV